MKRRIFLILGLLVVAVLTWMVATSWSIKDEVQPLANKILTLLDEGKVKTVWQQSSPKLRERSTLADFRSEVLALRNLLGSLKDTGEVRGWKLTQKSSERYAKIRIPATYDACECLAVLEFEDLDDGKWRLLSIAFEDLPKAASKKYLK